MILVNILQPGFTLQLPLPAGVAETGIKSTGINLKDFVAHMVPRSMVEAMATNEILQIVVFSGFFGIACAALGERARQVVIGIEEVSHVMLRVTNYVMYAAPIAVFAAIAAIIAKQGLGIIRRLRHLRRRVLWRHPDSVDRSVPDIDAVSWRAHPDAGQVGA